MGEIRENSSQRIRLNLAKNSTIHVSVFLQQPITLLILRLKTKSWHEIAAYYFILNLT